MSFSLLWCIILDREVICMKQIKKYKYIVLISIFILIIAVFSMTNLYFKRNGQFKRYFVRSNQYFFICKFPNLNITGFKSGSSIFDTHIINIEKGKFINAGMIDENNKLFYILENDSIKFYDFQGKIRYSYGYTDSGKKIISGCISNLNGGDTSEILILTGNKNEEYGDELIIYSYDNELKEIFRQSFKELNPWKVQTADVDGDGIKEISIGVYKTTKFHSVLSKRPFIYNWDGKEVSPKWLGSRLSRPFEDYVFCDIDNDKMDEIVSAEALQDGRKALNSYKWKGFGFEAIGGSESYTDIADLSVYRDNTLKQNISARTKEKNKWKQLDFIYTDNKLAVFNTK